MGKMDDQSKTLLAEISSELLEILRDGGSTEEKRRQADDWLRSLSDKHPDLEIEQGLHDYYVAEAKRLREKFSRTEDLIEKLDIGRSIEGFLEKAREASEAGAKGRGADDGADE